MEATALELFAFACVGAVIYSYAIYPLFLTLIAANVQVVRDARYVFKKLERRSLPTQELPSVAVIIAAYNEERHITARIENLLTIDYPAELIRIYIGSDGSKDGTNALLKSISDPRVHAIVFEQNRGKASVLNDLVAMAEAPILVFSDANTMFEKSALRRLVAPFGNADTGAVSVELRLEKSGGDNQDSLYWRVEQYLKFFEARIGGLLGANGAIYAIRSTLWSPLRPDTICDDFRIAMHVATTGHTLVYEPTAWASEETPDSIHDEFLRRVRIGIGNFQELVRHPEYFFRTSWATRFTYLSHKVLRWLSPHLLIAALLASAVLSSQSSFWKVLLAIQLTGYFFSWILYRRNKAGYSVPSPLRIPLFLFALNWALLIASIRYATGQYRGVWRRTRR